MGILIDKRIKRTDIIGKFVEFSSRPDYMLNFQSLKTDTTVS